MAAKFSFDQINIPRIRTRKALLCLDFQHDFVDAGGALYAPEPEGYAERTVQLAEAFRKTDFVIWVRSVFEKHRRVQPDQLMTTDKLITRHAAPSEPPRGRRMTQTDEEDISADHEAFLSNGDADKPVCVRRGTPGAEFAALFKDRIAPQDLKLVKSDYAAFTEEMVFTFRSRLITEVWICGSLTNIGVYATALAAASYGYAITVVEDCCGYRTPIRHNNAIRKLVELTGCDVVQFADAMATLRAASAGANKITLPERSKQSSSKRAAKQHRQQPGEPSASQSASKAASSKAEPSAATPSTAGAAKDAKSKSTEPLSSKKNEMDEEAGATTEGATAAEAAAGASAARAARATLDEVKSEASPKPDDSQPQSKQMEADGKPARKKDKKKKGTASEVIVASEKSTGRSVEANTESGERSTDRSVEARTESGEKSTDRSVEANTESDKKSTGRTVQANTESDEESHDQQKVEKPRGAKVKDSKGASGAAEAGKLTASDEGPEKTAGPVTRQEPSKSQLRKEASSEEMAPAEDPTKVQEGTSGEVVDAPSETPEPPPGPICEGDTQLHLDILPPELEATAFDLLSEEVQWQTMSHQGGEVPRLVAVQGEVNPEDGSMPVYRHPADESPPLLPFTKTVREIKELVEKKLGHEMNHVLIQLYRSGNDYISEHSDKTLDICPRSYIANVSLGAQRTMTLRTKRVERDYTLKGSQPSASDARQQLPKPSDEKAKADEKGSDSKASAAPSAPAAKADPDSLRREIVRVPLPHNSLFQLGLRTNARWLHAIRPDKRAERDRSPPSLANEGRRISLTFRRIGTFLSADETLIWGQGAKGKTRAEAGKVINGQTDEAICMLKAFGTENHSTAREFDWNRWYGEGFNVLHMGGPAPRLFLGDAALVNTAVVAWLGECGVNWARGSVGTGAPVAVGASAAAGNADGAEEKRGRREKLVEDLDALPKDKKWDAHGERYFDQIRLVDNDDKRTAVRGVRNILTWIEKRYGAKTASAGTGDEKVVEGGSEAKAEKVAKEDTEKGSPAKESTAETEADKTPSVATTTKQSVPDALDQALDLLKATHHALRQIIEGNASTLQTLMQSDLQVFEDLLEKGATEFISGDAVGPADCVVWAVLDYLRRDAAAERQAAEAAAKKAKQKAKKATVDDKEKKAKEGEPDESSAAESAGTAAKPESGEFGLPRLDVWFEKMNRREGLARAKRIALERLPLSSP